MQEKSRLSIKKLLVMTVLMLLVVFSVAIVRTIQNRGKIKINVHQMPGDAVIKINGQTQSSSTLYLYPGEHSLTVSKEGFQAETRKIDISNVPSEPNREFFFMLIPVSDEAVEWVNRNAAEYSKFEQRAQEAYNKNNQHLAEDLPITKDLPYRGELYNIEYYLNGDDFRIQIEADGPLGRQVALERIRSLGHEPSDYEIEFLNLDNPFTSNNEASLNE